MSWSAPQPPQELSVDGKEAPEPVVESGKNEAEEEEAIEDDGEEILAPLFEGFIMKGGYVSLRLCAQFLSYTLARKGRNIKNIAELDRLVDEVSSLVFFHLRAQTHILNR